VGHTAQVNCVRWLPLAPPSSSPDDGDASSSARPQFLATGSADATIRVWRWGGAHAAGGGPPWACLAVLRGHRAGVSSLAAHVVPSDGGDEGDTLLLASTAGDDQVIIWRCALGVGEEEEGRLRQGAWALQQSLPVGPHLQLAAAFAPAPHDARTTLLATGGADGAVRLHAAPPGGAGAFVQVASLVGHENWVRSLAFTALQEPGGPRELLLASASQDRYIRLWRIAPADAPADAAGAHAAGPAAAADPAAAAAAAITRYAPRPAFRAGGAAYAASLEALLVGHEDWVHSVAWAPRGSGGGAAAAGRAGATLLSAAMDRTMVLWTHGAGGLWANSASVGDAGAACLGYFAGAFSPDGASILANGFTGAGNALLPVR